MTEIRLAAGIIERDGTILLVASQYPNQREPLWGLPGGRPRANELLDEALRRECAEETGLAVAIDGLAYVSESFDTAGGAHVLAHTFRVHAPGPVRPPRHDAHVVAVDWVPIDALTERIAIAVVRDPLVAYLRGEKRGYFGYGEAGITIAFADAP